MEELGKVDNNVIRYEEYNLGEFASIVVPIGVCCVCKEETVCEFTENGKYYCTDCAFKIGAITSQQYLNNVGICIDAKAIVHEGQIYIARKNEKYDFEKTNKDYRQTKEYKKWRKNVFERDNYICQDCNKKGGTLNAHHLKKFKDYPKLRYDVNNGITLCEKCHRRRHKHD
ncbi:HNH endonuclease [Amedibacillus sp. YH-ame6]